MSRSIPFLLSLIILVPATSQAQYELAANVISAGPTHSIGPGVQLQGTLNEPGAGPTGSFSVDAGGGFWYIARAAADRVDTSSDPASHFELPDTIILAPAYPNPFNPSTTIAYAIPEAAHVRIAVYDELGRQVRILIDRKHAPGRYNVSLNGADLPSGTYVYRMESGSFNHTGAVTLVK